MNTASSKSLLAAALPSLALAVGGLSAAPEFKQPHMENALHFLQDAEKADDPVLPLQSAKEELHKATHDKDGFRVKTIEIIDQAIAEQRTGDKAKVKGEINNAIAALHSGMAHGH